MGVKSGSHCARRGILAGCRCSLAGIAGNGRRLVGGRLGLGKSLAVYCVRMTMWKHPCDGSWSLPTQVRSPSSGTGASV